jgi:hypothetical protein
MIALPVKRQLLRAAQPSRIVDLLSARLNSPWTPAIIAAVAHLLFVHTRLTTFAYDPSVFINVGSIQVDESKVPEGLRVFPRSPGYDGQYYYRLALNPFTFKQTDFGIKLDDPGYRQQRIVYPLFVWVLSLGQAWLVPAMMISVNHLALSAVGWLGGAYAQSIKRHALWGVVFAFYPGFLLTLARDLTEIVAIAFLLAGLLAMRSKRFIAATVFLSVSVLARETGILMVVGILLTWVAVRVGATRQPVPWYTFAVPLIVFDIWQWILVYVWSAPPLRTGTGHIGLPLQGLGTFLLNVIDLDSYDGLRLFSELSFLAVFSAYILGSIRSSLTLLHEKISWILYAIFAMLWTNKIWVEEWSFLRVLSEFYVLGAMIVLGSRIRWRALLFAYVGLLWILLFRIHVQLA